MPTRRKYLLVRPLPLIFGGITGFAFAVLLQQFGITPLTTIFLLSMILAGCLVFGLAVPTAFVVSRAAGDPRGRRRRGSVAAVSIVALAGIMSMLLVSLSAHAIVDGPCIATMNGERFGGLVELPEDGMIHWSFTSRAGNIEEWEVRLHYAFLSFPVEKGREAPHEATKQGEKSLNDYPRYGTGIYRLSGHVVTERGSTCTGSMDVKVPGNPVTTPMGGGALGLLAIGLIGSTWSGSAVAKRSAAPEEEEIEAQEEPQWVDEEP